METKNISSSQGKSLVIMFILGTSVLISGDSKSMADTWISIIIAILMFIPLAFIYGKLIQFFPGMDLFDILEKVYGKVLGKLFIGVYTFYFFHIGAMAVRNITEYVQVVSLPETPQYVTAILIGLLAIYIVNAGLSVLATWTKIVLPIIIIMILTTCIFAIPKFNYSHMKPILFNGWKPVFISGYSLLTFPFAETVVFMVFFSSLNDNKDATKVYLTSVILGGFILLITAVRNILLLGFPNVNNTYFPSHYATSIIDIPSFIQRIELLVSTALLLTGITKISTCLHASSIGAIKLFNLKKAKKTTAILCPFMIILSFFLYKSTMEMFNFLNVYKYYVIPFQFIIPLLTIIVAVIRKKGIRA